MAITRQTLLDAARQQPDIPVLIIGAGINGIGVFRELALNGVDALLVDRGDFCAGASAASSHMAHGGLRYLENGEFRLVKEALTERNRLLQNAPHYVKPLPTTIPIFKWFSGLFNAPLKFLGWLDRPSERGAITIKAGLTMYDIFTSGQQTLPRHRFASRKRSLAERPLLNPDIICTATYYDGLMPCPERICVELILDAEARHPGARALNYVSAVSAAGGAVTLRDELTGATFEVRPQLVVNAAGPWIDLVNDGLRQPSRLIGGTKGAHLLLDNPTLHAATRGHELFFENKDGRITLFFALGDKVIAGTTDIPVDNPDQVEVTDDEVDYILESIRIVFPDIAVDRSQIVFWFTGVRPLPRQDAATAGQISRDHQIELTPPGGSVSFPIYSLVGGKWTTFRAFAEQTADKLLPLLHRERGASSARLAFGGGVGYPRGEAARARWIEVVAGKTGLDTAHIAALFERYGTRAAEVAAFMQAGPDEPLAHVPGYTRREAQFLAERERVVHLDDLLLRRSLLAMLGHVSAASLPELAAALAEPLGWTPEQAAAEAARAHDLLTRRHGMRLER